jgi:arginyl-tRNA synthetase
MIALRPAIKTILSKAAAHAFADDALIDPDVSWSTQRQYGHMQCNSAMQWAKVLHLPPHEIATRWVAAIKKLDALAPISVFSALSVAGPGFINMTLSPDYLIGFLEHCLSQPAMGLQESKPQRIVVDFSSPNVAKEMHVGHLRSTIIGDCLARVFEWVGHDVLRLNHIGDWGTAFGMLIAYLNEHHPDFLSRDPPCSLSDLLHYYQAAKKAFDTDPDFKKRAHDAVVALQSGDQQARALWTHIVDLSARGYEAIYRLLDIHLETRGESYYQSRLQPMLDEGLKQGVIESSDGALCIFLPGYTGRDDQPLPFMLQKSDGGYNYATTDLAALKQRVSEEHADRIIYVTDLGQKLHFDMLFGAAEALGFVDRRTVRLDHVSFGFVLDDKGKKFKTRSGEAVPLMHLIERAQEDAGKRMRAKSKHQDDPDDLMQRASALGINAIKYADLSSHRSHDYVFNFDRMLRFEGNTAAFIMYAYVRLQSIIRKSTITLSDHPVLDQSTLRHAAAVHLLFYLCRFNDVLLMVMDDLLPHRLTDYLFGLAECCHAFFRDCPVHGSDDEQTHLILLHHASLILKQGMLLLGLSVIDRM